MEVLFAILIVCTAALGLGAGLILTGRAPRTACGGQEACSGRCAVCPRRKGGEDA